MQASPLQMAMVASMFANGGTCYYPRLIDRVVDQNGQDAVDPDTGKLVATGPRVRCNLERDLGLKPDQIERVRRGMWKVVNEQGGTAPRAKIPGVEVAGKTGTAEFWRNGIKDNHTWFMCFAPYQKPKYAVVRVHPGRQGRGGHGGAHRHAHPGGTLRHGRGHVQARGQAARPRQGQFRVHQQRRFHPAHPRARARRDAEHPNGKPVAMSEGDEAPPPSDEHESTTTSDKNTDHDRVKHAAPKLRENRRVQRRRRRLGSSTSPGPMPTATFPKIHR